MYRSLVRPLLFRCDAETVHNGAIRFSEIVGSVPPLRAAVARWYGVLDERLRSNVAGVSFPNPIGLAAGYDKSGKAIRMMAALGFGFVEVGSVSADPSEGNPRPRLWRLPLDRAICVHYGLPNDGAEAIARRLAGQSVPVPLGINIVKTNRGPNAPPDREDAVLEDYVRSVSKLKSRADYLNLNLSCPNTEMGRDFFATAGNIARLLTALGDLDLACPLFLKVSPVGGIATIDRLLEEVDPFSFVSGFMFNLPPGKPEQLATPRSVWESMPGAVSGAPSRAVLDRSLRELYQRMDRSRYRIMASGGVFSAEDAYEKIRFGASLVQLMTGLTYEGPALVARINRGLRQLLERDGFDNIADAVGTAASDHG
ncbi:MAG: quinone-dependent dihydroorotate dehydrogenase [Planctomycetota bacterium]